MYYNSTTLESLVYAPRFWYLPPPEQVKSP
jgi:hypothetical protein